MISCDRALELISERLDAPLSPEDQRALEEHLAVCADCRALLADFEEMERVLPTMNAPVPPDFTQSVLDRVKAEKVVDLSAARTARRPWKQWAATAAVFAVVLLGAGALGLDQLADRFGGGTSTAAAPTQDSAGLTAGAGESSADTAAPRSNAATGATALASTQPQEKSEAAAGGDAAPDGDAPVSSDRSGSSVQSTPPADSGGGSQPSVDGSSPAAPAVTAPAPEPKSTQLPRENAPSPTNGIEPAGMPYAAENSLTLTEEQARKVAFDALGGYDAYPDASLEDGTLATEEDGSALVLEDTGLSDNGKYYTFRLDRTFPGSTRTETVNFCAVPLSGGTTLVCRDETLLENLSPEDPGWAEAKAAYDQAQQNYFDTIHN